LTVLIKPDNNGSNVTVHIPNYYFLTIDRKADEFKMSPEIEIIMVPPFSNDNKGLFLISAQPSFLEKQYDLDQFYLIQPLSIGLVKFNQKDTNTDGVADTLEAHISIIVHDIIFYSLEIKLEVFLVKDSNIIKKKTNYQPNSLGEYQSITTYTFSELFQTTNPPIPLFNKGDNEGYFLRRYTN
jgi:hypothetical protein